MDGWVIVKAVLRIFLQQATKIRKKEEDDVLTLFGQDQKMLIWPNTVTKKPITPAHVTIEMTSLILKNENEVV